ncbi:caspase family protein [Arcicella sp. DC2W]|uniref:Caspase family protein n=1 Tax=Arcicella gelida TaxID=2984195 RepID=A0ABU5SAU2_9BACT|nr:caspase family protein [Arcicella sp. DC2W]MEA5405579.1 caspase family protein [Arcicella sp. DC2W]
MTETIDISQENTFAVIIAIEDYRFNDGSIGITPVKYARNDATKFKKMLREEFQIPEDNITMWLDKDTTKSAFENELPYSIRQLSKGQKFIFYYAGHGFFSSSQNKLTCWDTHPDNLVGTTVSINEVLLKPLEETECQQSIIFLDCCSNYIKDKLSSRDIISNFNDREFEAFLKSKEYNAVFMSCSPGEKSYSNDILKHGIWTYHLIEALKGNIPDVILRKQFITDNSIKNYLAIAVPRFITEKTEHRGTQRPYAKINSTGDFLIRKLPVVEEKLNNEFPKLNLKFDNASFRKVTFVPIKRAKGFQRGHFIPDKVSASGNLFIQRVFNDNLEEEIQEIYQNTKEVLSLRKRHIQIVSEVGGGSVECDTYRYFIEVEQSSDNPAEAKMVRRLIIRVRREELVENFDDIFPQQIDEIVIPYEGKIDFDELVEKFENLKDEDRGKLYDNEMKGEIEYTTYSGLTIKVDVEDLEITITPNKTMKCLELIDTTIEGLKKISIGKVNLLK